MTLKEKYTIKNKKRMKQFIFIYSILAIFFGMYFSFAKYEGNSEGYTKITVANWKISLNDKELTSNNNTLRDVITLIPMTNIDTNNPDKIKSGQTGYFDIKINPAGTEVSFEYQLALDLTNSTLPSKLKITSYSLDGGITVNTLPEDNTLRNAVLLNGKNIFTDSDTKTIRYYWEWLDGEDEDSSYTIIVNAEIKQVL